VNDRNPCRIERRKGIPATHVDGVADCDGLVPWSEIQRVGHVLWRGCTGTKYDYLVLQLGDGRHLWCEALHGDEAAWHQALRGLRGMRRFRLADLKHLDAGTLSFCSSAVLWPPGERGDIMYALPRTRLARLLIDDALVRAAPRPMR
jgi:hypothetical protein